MKISETDSKYRIRLKGRYNACCTHCFHCDARFGDQDYHKTLHGVAEWKGDAVLVWECQECFKFSFYHLNPALYNTACGFWERGANEV